MGPLFKQFFSDLINSPEKVVLWFRFCMQSFSALLTTVLMTAMGPDGIPDLEVMKTWGWKGWGIRFLVAGLFGSAVAVKAGEKNK